MGVQYIPTNVSKFTTNNTTTGVNNSNAKDDSGAVNLC